MTRSLIRLLVRLYPRAWRERYGEEYAALLAEHGLGPGRPSTCSPARWTRASAPAARRRSTPAGAMSWCSGRGRRPRTSRPGSGSSAWPSTRTSCGRRAPMPGSRPGSGRSWPAAAVAGVALLAAAPRRWAGRSSRGGHDTPARPHPPAGGVCRGGRCIRAGRDHAGRDRACRRATAAARSAEPGAPGGLAGAIEWGCRGGRQRCDARRAPSPPFRPPSSAGPSRAWASAPPVWR